MNRSKLRIQSDGLIRLTSNDLKSLPFVHFDSQMEDVDYRTKYLQSGSLNATGLSEWISESNPTVSVGWSWRLTQISFGSMSVNRFGPYITNIEFEETTVLDSTLDEIFADQSIWIQHAITAWLSILKGGPARCT